MVLWRPLALALSSVKGASSWLLPDRPALSLAVDKQANKMSLLLSRLGPKPKQGREYRSLEPGHPRASRAYILYRYSRMAATICIKFSAQHRGMYGIVRSGVFSQLVALFSLAHWQGSSPGDEKKRQGPFPNRPPACVCIQLP